VVSVFRSCTRTSHLWLAYCLYFIIVYSYFDMCIHISVYMYICIFTNVYVCICVHARMYIIIYVCVCLCVLVRICVRVHLSLSVCACARTRVRVHACARVCVCTHVFVCVCVRQVLLPDRSEWSVGHLPNRSIFHLRALYSIKRAVCCLCGIPHKHVCMYVYINI